ncbi:MAG: hypothetical protein JOZ21_08110 [Verrucomicrobia bacterium]|nr:hypothetical protein [Verrucomicrobiota bacterium]
MTTITQTPAGVLRVRPFRRDEPVEREAFGKGFAISHIFQLIWTKIANSSGCGVRHSTFNVCGCHDATAYKSHTEVTKVRGGHKGYLEGVLNRAKPDANVGIYLD